MAFKFPTRQQRTAVIGRTGSGKTQLGVWLLSEAQIESMPWVVFDYKGDALINSIPYREEIGFNDTPKKPGVYVIHPLPDTQDELVENFLMRIWERGNTGVFVDEAFMFPKKGAYQACLTQGRSKNIPMINCTQKPSYIPMHVFTEADHVSVFHLNDKRDQKRVNEFAPIPFERKIPQYHSHWYRVTDDTLLGLRPVPDADSLLETFARRLAPKRRVI